MRLLVSVRSAAEAESALAGGAHIIDAKEPRRGSLGPVSPAVLREIAGQVRPEIPLSVALGELASAAEARRRLSELPLEARPGGVFLKLGFAARSSNEAIARLLAAALETAGSLRSKPQLVAVTYADHVRTGLPSPEIISLIAIERGASGLLLDTAIKDGTGLGNWLDARALASWVARGRGAGLLTALAGSLSADTLDQAIAASPDVIGVRGAACSGGRDGVVQSSQVRTLVDIIDNQRLAKRHARSAMEPISEAPTY